MSKDPTTRSVLDRAALPRYADRLAELTAETTPHRGELDVSRTLRHLTLMFELSLGDRAVKDRSLPLVRDLAYLVGFRLAPSWAGDRFEGGAEAFPPPEGDFRAERRLLISDMQRFVDRLEWTPRARETHPLLGPIRLTRWARVHGVHVDHHLRLFGV